MSSSTSERPTAILYCRVSTRGQVERGYSLREQAERLLAYSEEHGLQVLEVVEDAGVSGAAYAGRPGLTKVRGRVAEGGVSVVLATERDRFARQPEIIYLLKKELARHGTQLRALNQQADDSPVGVLTEGILDQIAMFFRAQFAEKSMENKRKKAREGKASGSGTPPFGFRTPQTGDPLKWTKSRCRPCGVSSLRWRTAQHSTPSARR
jgi:site-specific DNA recombinase